ncbi:sulfotransferase family 2 domain-containing protein [Pseudaestuariivita sp.]|uniref:sulfotransferase family 2 domain-containing protein n=1 Tax=Pseudaestuariivita sp. TaxID=2211669 RepID=UPI004058E0C9
MVIAVDAFQIAYMALPKAGCTSVKSALLALDPTAPAPETITDSEEVHDIYQTMRFRPHRWHKYRKHWRFCVVRDPVKRLMSAYTDRVVGRQELHNSPNLSHPDYAHLPLDPDPDFFFQNLDAYIGASSVVKHHVLPAWLFLGPRQVQEHFDRVYKTEELGQLADDLSARTGREVQMPRANSSKARLTLGDLAPKTVQAISARLAAEYVYLGGLYRNPLPAHTA